MTELDRLAEMAGILPDYVDAWGARQRVSKATKAALLDALGVEAGTPEEIAGSLRRLEEAPWRRALAPALVVSKTRGARGIIPITLPAALVDLPIPWRLEYEDGQGLAGELRPADFPLIERRSVDGRSVERRAFTLPSPVPLGYHRFRLRAEDQASVIIAVPRRSFVAAPRRWALMLQLYGFKSARNWGIGDFTDLAGIARLGASLGAAAIGLNPLHSQFPENPAHVSPYSPSHRQFLAARYLDVEAVPEFAECSEAQRLAASPDVQARLHALRATPLVDYVGVAAEKRPILDLLYHDFRVRHLNVPASVRGQAFRFFQGAKGDALETLALFQALAERFSPVPWREWPMGFRDPRTPEVASFAAEYRNRVEFFQYLQFLAHEQLAAAAAEARDVGMSIGLYQDLALAPDSNGAEAWSRQALLARRATLGAPPDDWNLKGQDWGLPPYDPWALADAAFRPFIEVLRANMAYAGALRIDHIMGLERQFWIPTGAAPCDGGYVRFPVDELFGILALESRRYKCIVVGEDLGTVPDGFNARMRRAGVLSYRLLYFAQTARGAFIAPRRYPAAAAVAANTHDLATLAGYWRGRDLALRAELDLFPSEAAKDAALASRARAYRALVRALKREGLLDPSHVEDRGELTLEVVTAIVRFLARTPSRILLLDFADVVGEIEQVNLPGTVGEHANWRRKLTVGLEALAHDPRLHKLAAAIADERGRDGGAAA